MCADNCTDGTAREAEAAGAHVFETVGNTHKKAGALNQVLDLLLPELGDEDAVLVMDADSVLAPTFVAEAARHLRDGVGGVGGIFTGRSGGGFVGMLQRNEYARYARDVARLKGKVLVLTGHRDAVLGARRSATSSGRAPKGRCPAARRRSTTRTSSPRTTSSRSPCCTSATRCLAEGLPADDRGDGRRGATSTGSACAGSAARSRTSATTA